MCYMAPVELSIYLNLYLREWHSQLSLFLLFAEKGWGGHLNPAIPFHSLTGMELPYKFGILQYFFFKFPFILLFKNCWHSSNTYLSFSKVGDRHCISYNFAFDKSLKQSLQEFILYTVVHLIQMGQ